MRDKVLEHRFVESFPEVLEPGVLYVSFEYGSVTHSCCCGCGEEVVTPLTPTDWNITYDGETVTLHPSVGSWTLPCRSHYVTRLLAVSDAGALQQRVAQKAYQRGQERFDVVRVQIWRAVLPAFRERFDQHVSPVRSISISALLG